MPSWSKGSFSNPQDTKIVREHLLKLLDQCVKSPLTLLLAPAGSGKSTLLADWLKRREPDSFAFLSLTSADASPVHFFRHWLEGLRRDRKSTRLNSSHVRISYAVFCLKKKKKQKQTILMNT